MMHSMSDSNFELSNSLKALGQRNSLRILVNSPFLNIKYSGKVEMKSLRKDLEKK